SPQSFSKLRAGFRRVVRIQNRGHDTNASGSGGDHIVEVRKVDPANGKPGTTYICGCPADVIERNRFCSRFGARGIDGTNGDIIRPGREGALGLSWRMRRQANSYFALRTSHCRHMLVSSIEEVLLPQVAELGADLVGNVEMIVDDQAN